MRCRLPPHRAWFPARNGGRVSLPVVQPSSGSLRRFQGSRLSADGRARKDIRIALVEFFDAPARSEACLASAESKILQSRSPLEWTDASAGLMLNAWDRRIRRSVARAAGVW